MLGHILLHVHVELDDGVDGHGRRKRGDHLELLYVFVRRRYPVVVV